MTDHRRLGPPRVSAHLPSEDLPWVDWRWWRRCVARTDRKPYRRGRCDLVRDHLCDHALDRGMDIPRWSTAWVPVQFHRGGPISYDG